MSDYLKVTARGTILVPGTREQLKAGRKLERAQCLQMFGSAGEIDRLVDQGYLVRLTEQVDKDEHPLPPQTTMPPPHPAEIEKDEPAMVTVPKGEAPGNVVPVGAVSEEPVAVVKETPEPVVVSKGPWDLDPATLTEKDVNELNVMISERSLGEAGPFETVEEAVAWLSQNFTEEPPAVATG